MTRQQLDDCFAHDKDRLLHVEALERLRAGVSPIAAAEDVPLSEAGGRILAEPVTAPFAIPAHTNAAVDGYAFAYADYDRDKGVRLPVAGRAAAGHALDEAPAPGVAVRIFTGAVLPDGLDSCVMQEDVETEQHGLESFVHLPPGLKQGANIRPAGEDVHQGELAAQPGQVLRPQDIAAIAATGRAAVRCFERLRVALFSTGDEIIRPGTALTEGRVYDANAPMLAALVALTGAEVSDLGILPDDPDIVRTSLAQAAASHDVLLTSGGVSKGEADHVIETLQQHGVLHVWQLAIKPGRPVAFGRLNDAVIAALPGNPVAVFVCFLLYVRPMLMRLGGARWPEPRRFRLRAAFGISKKPGRREFWRASLELGPDGALWAHKYPRDGSGLISSLRAADGLIDIAETIERVNEGDMVDFLPFAEFGILRD